MFIDKRVDQFGEFGHCHLGYDNPHPFPSPISYRI